MARRATSRWPGRDGPGTHKVGHHNFIRAKTNLVEGPGWVGPNALIPSWEAQTAWLELHTHFGDATDDIREG